MVNYSVLEVDSVIVEFNHETVLQNVYLKMEVGQVVALIGRNGAGKTTLFKVIAGLKGALGTVRINSIFIHHRKRYKFINILPQYNFIPVWLTVNRVLKDYQISSSDLINWFPGFRDKLSSRLSKLSGGEKRILEVFIVLYSKGAFCILDEPFNFLSPLQIDTVKACIRQQAKTKGILITDHQVQDVIDIADKHYELNNGNLVLKKE